MFGCTQAEDTAGQVDSRRVAAVAAMAEAVALSMSHNCKGRCIATWRKGQRNFELVCISRAQNLESCFKGMAGGQRWAEIRRKRGKGNTPPNFRDFASVISRMLNRKRVSCVMELLELNYFVNEC
jgi:hypothetical protein